MWERDAEERRDSLRGAEPFSRNSQRSFQRKKFNGKFRRNSQATARDSLVLRPPSRGGRRKRPRKKIRRVSETGRDGSEEAPRKGLARSRWSRAISEHCRASKSEHCRSRVKTYGATLETRNSVAIPSQFRIAVPFKMERERESGEGETFDSRETVPRRAGSACGRGDGGRARSRGETSAEKTGAVACRAGAVFGTAAAARAPGRAPAAAPPVHPARPPTAATPAAAPARRRDARAPPALDGRRRIRRAAAAATATAAAAGTVHGLPPELLRPRGLGSRAK